MPYLDHISSPQDIKKLNIRQLSTLSKEIRAFLIRSVAKTGGHLASNLGVVELTVALHHCFHTPKDKIIWDVGHQAYVHKILTGRRDRFNTLRQYKGLSGYPKSSESVHDCFDAGHSSTSISAALGFAISRDIQKDHYHVAAVIGDGSMTGGLAFEGLNNAGRADTNLIVILNDNEMSISENVGAVSKHLNSIRTAPSYIGAKKGVHNLLNKMPRVGGKIGRLIERTKDGIKYFFISGILFEEFGFKYIGPIDGHNMDELVDVLEKAKKIEGPVLIHVFTKKGKGYAPAERNPERYHGVERFDIRTGEALQTLPAHDTYSDIFSKALADLGAENSRIAAITASMPSGTGLSLFASRFPHRTFDVGIAEGHAVTFAAGMAKNGLIPVFAVYSSFLQRSYDQIIHDVCIQQLPVIFAIDRAGISGSDGETHQGIFDLSYLTHIPHMTIMAPRNGRELRDMLAFAAALGRPAAIRYPKGRDNAILPDSAPPLVLGQSEYLWQGRDVAILSVGTMIEQAYAAAMALRQAGYDPTLVNVRFVKPIDMALLQELMAYQHIFILEDNVTSGGFGACALMKLTEMEPKGSLPHIHLLALPDIFIEQGTREELFKQYGLDAAQISRRILNILEEGKNHA